MLWLAASIAVAAVPVVLPAGEDPAAWGEALRRADLVAADALPAEGARVGVETTSAGWRIAAVDDGGVRRVLDVAIPATDADRARVAWLCASLAERPALPVRAPVAAASPAPPAPKPPVAPKAPVQPVRSEVVAPPPEDPVVVLADTTLPFTTTRPFAGVVAEPIPDVAHRAWPRMLGLSVGPSIGIARHATLDVQAEVGAALLLRAGPFHVRGSLAATTGADDGGEKYSEFTVRGGIGVAPAGPVAPVLAGGLGMLRQRWTRTDDTGRHTHWGPSPWFLLGLRLEPPRLTPFELAWTGHPTETGWTHAFAVTTWFVAPK